MFFNQQKLTSVNAVSARLYLLGGINQAGLNELKADKPKVDLMPLKPH